MNTSQKLSGIGPRPGPSGPVVVKLGSAVARAEDGTLDQASLSALVRQIANQMSADQPIVLVSSGAVALGLSAAPRSVLEERDPIQRRQLLAALGQTRLMAFYQEAFGRHGLMAAQVLATRQDFATRRHYLNMRSCLLSALKHGVVPVVNENDVVSVTELMFTDNDELAGLLATMLGASRLILLTNVDGVFDGPPEHPDSQLINVWKGQSFRAGEPSTPSEFGRGGIASKIRSAQRLAGLGTEVWIAHGRRAGIINDICGGQGMGTCFEAEDRPVTQSRRWVAGAPAGAAAVKINQGAADALQDQQRLTSLLPVGVVAIVGHFERGDIVKILDEKDRAIGYGRAQYSASTAATRLGLQRQKPLIHYDYLYIEP